MRRMMSSFSPGGAASASTSVTKPYLYSCRTNPAMVSVAVLIDENGGRRLLLAASRTKAADGDFVTAGLEALGHRQPRLRRVRQQVNVVGAAAMVAVKMMVVLHVRAVTRGGPVQIHQADQATVHQRIEAIVNGGHGNLRHFLLRADE